MAVYAYQALVHYHGNRSLFIHSPRPELSTAENILHMLRPDSRYTELEATLLDLALVLHAEHGGGNNSSCTVPVVSSSGTDTYSAMAAALGYTCVPALPDQAAGDPVEAFVALQQEVGEFTSAAADAFRGGKAMVSRNEIKRLQYRYNELISALNQLLATAAARVPAPVEEG